MSVVCRTRQSPRLGPLSPAHESGWRAVRRTGVARCVSEGRALHVRGSEESCYRTSYYSEVRRAGAVSPPRWPIRTPVNFDGHGCETCRKVIARAIPPCFGTMCAWCVMRDNSLNGRLSVPRAHGETDSRPDRPGCGQRHVERRGRPAPHVSCHTVSCRPCRVVPCSVVSTWSLGSSLICTRGSAEPMVLLFVM